jgi:hypothetical protein
MGPTIETTSYKNAHDLTFGYKKTTGTPYHRYHVHNNTHVGAVYCTNVHISAPNTITYVNTSTFKTPWNRFNYANMAPKMKLITTHIKFTSEELDILYLL